MDQGDAHVYIAMSGMLPALAAMWWVDRLDAKRPEPLKLRLMVAAFGALSFVPALVIELVLLRVVGDRVEPRTTYQGATFYAFVVAGATEEACKILVVYWVVWWRPEFDERMDGIVYAGRAGLGFALVENVGYLIVQPSLSGQIAQWILRAVLAVPGHAIWSSLIGALAAQRRFDGRGPGVVGGYLLAVAFHGCYDAALFLRAPLELEGHTRLADAVIAVPFALTILGVVVLRGLARHALALDDRDAALRLSQVQVQPPAAPA